MTATYASLGITDSVLVDTWSSPMPYRDPVSSDMEGGNVRMRSLPGDKVAQIQFDILYTNAEFVTLENYIKNTLVNGTSRFLMNVKYSAGANKAVRTVQFAKSYQPVPMPPLFVQVTFVLWVYPS